MAAPRTFIRYAPPSALRFSLWITLGFLVLVLDQGTKFWVEHAFNPDTRIAVTSFFNLVLAHNTGAAFSFLSDAGGWQRWLFTGLAGAVVATIVVLLWKHNGKKLFSFALTMIAAGALGNLIDRAVYGFVIDFLDFHAGGWHWPAFNVADIAICVGAGLLILDELLGVSRER